MIDGIELGAIYELAERLTEQGVQAHAVPRSAGQLADEPRTQPRTRDRTSR